MDTDVPISQFAISKTEPPDAEHLDPDRLRALLGRALR